MENTKKYPIKIVANKTGLSMHVIRIWEKRYNAVTPERTETNRRLYSTEDILKLQLLSKAIEVGHTISSIANFSLSDLKSLVEDERGTEQHINGETDFIDTSEFVDSFLSHIKTLDVKRLELILQQASISMSRPVLIEKVIVPIIEKIGENWREGSIRIYHEHIATVVLRSFLTSLTNASEYELNAPHIVVTTLKGQIHELGALIVAASAASEGWKVTYLGPNLPAEEITAVAQSVKAQIVCLSIVYPAGDPNIIQELEKIGQFLPSQISLLVGGRSALSYKSTLDKINAKVIGNIKELRKYLQHLESQELYK